MSSRLLIPGAAALVATLLALHLPGALDARRASREAALEEAVRTADIHFLELRLADDPDNWLLADHLADLYAAHFRTAADPLDIERAERLVRRTLPLRSDPTYGWVRLSSLLLTQHRFREAFTAARAATARERPPDGALGMLVDAARAYGEYAVADSAFALMTRGTFAYAIRSDATLAPEDAIQQIGQACARLDERAAMRDLRAWCITRLADREIARGRLEAGRTLIGRALAVHPGNRGALETAADHAYATEDWREAERRYTEILSPAHPDLYLRLAEVRRHLGRHAEADALEQRFLDIASDPSLEALFGLELALYHARNDACERALPLAAAELERRHSAEALAGVARVRSICSPLAEVAPG